MDTRILRISSILLVCLAFELPAQAGALKRSPTVDRLAIIALENQWIDAKDEATLDRVLAEDFVHLVYTGDIINKTQKIEWLMKHPRPANRHARFVRMDVRQFGDVSQACGTVSVSDDSGNEVSRSVFTDVFVYRDGRWQAVSAQETVVASESSRQFAIVFGSRSVQLDKMSFGPAIKHHKCIA